MIERECLVCGTVFSTYPSKIKLGRGKYCSKACSDSVTLIRPGEHRSLDTEIRKGEPLPDHIHLPQKGKRPANYVDGRYSTLYRQLIDKDSCGQCGRSDQLVIHHTNFNHYDNNTDNLDILCNSCHSRLHKLVWWQIRKSKEVIPHSPRKFA